jgi:hypothetical protein
MLPPVIADSLRLATEKFVRRVVPRQTPCIASRTDIISRAYYAKKVRIPAVTPNGVVGCGAQRCWIRCV